MSMVGGLDLSKVVPDVAGAALRKAIPENVDMTRSHLQTDGWRGYLPIGPEFLSHESVNHDDGEHVRGNVTTNAAEGYSASRSGRSTARTTTSRKSTFRATRPSSTSGTPPAS
jgi:hypothetical protein